MLSKKTPEAKFQDSQWKRLQEINYANRVITEDIQEGNVLDLGCGDGSLIERITKKGLNGMGLDLSEAAITIAKERGLDCRVHDLTEKLPFADNSFTNVILIDVLEHLYRPLPILQEAARVSSKYVYISTPNFVSLPARLQVLRGKVPENNTPRDGHVYWMTEEVMSRFVKESGLVIDAVFNNTFWQQRPVIGSTMRTLVRMYPSLFALAFILRLRKIDI